MERLQKVLAQAGVASRRKCEEMILAGRVSVNDEVVTALGTKTDPSIDTIKVDGRKVQIERKIYIAFHKPKGVITSMSDPEGRKVIADFLGGIAQRVYPVGRLDYDTEGLLLLTNDGEMANALTHPRFGVPKTYHATVKGVPHGDDLDRLRNGVMLDDGMTAPADVEYYDVDTDANRSVITITIQEGRNRQVRRMFEAIRFKVEKLKRVRFGPLSLAGLARGKHRNLSEEEVRELRLAVKQDT